MHYWNSETEFFDPDTQLRSQLFYGQLLEILKTLKLSLQERNDLRILFNDIQRTLNIIWPGCRVKVFGSVITGLAFKASDMDCCIELPAHCEDDPVVCLKKIFRYVVGRNSGFEYVSVAPFATVPVITLSHLKTDRKCDITFNGYIAVETSKLVKYLLSLDESALNLAIIIKYWSKIYKLTHTKHLSNHAITLLVIFFLQRQNILPSVASLQENTVVNMTEGWNTAFSRGITTSRYSKCLYYLLGDFFKYYSNFDFESFVVCPYLGYPVRRSRFLGITTSLRNEFRLYDERVRNSTCESFQLSNLCVQHPFQHNRNCTVYVSEPLVDNLQVCFSTAVYFYENSSTWDFLRNLIFNGKNMPPLPFPPEFKTQHYTLPIEGVPKKGWSWKFYFVCSISIYTVCWFLTKSPKV